MEGFSQQSEMLGFVSQKLFWWLGGDRMVSRR